MPRWNTVFIVPTVFLLLVFFAKTLPASKNTGRDVLDNLKNVGTDTPINTKAPPSVRSFNANHSCATKIAKKEIVLKTQKLQIPFIANNGQVDEMVAFYANTFGGTVFVTKDGDIVYSLPVKGLELGVQGLEVRGQNTGSNGCLPILCAESDRPTPQPSMVRLTQLWSLKNVSIIHFLTGDEGGFSINNPQFQSTMRHGQTVEVYCNTPLNAHAAHSTSDPKSESKGVVLKEKLVGGKVHKIQGLDKGITKVNYFRGKDTSQWRRSIPTYDGVTLGEVYKGITLKLKAYGNNVEKLFYVKPNIDPEKIRIKLSGAKTIQVNKEGQLEAETESGTVKFSRPVAYQEINGKRVDVAVVYDIQRSRGRDQWPETRSRNTGTNRSKPQSEIQNQKSEDPLSGVHDSRPATRNPQSVYSFKVAAYDRSKELIIDPLLASTFLGGSGDDVINSLSIDSGGNVYVTGVTTSPNFPATTGAYDTLLGGSQDVFVSKLDGDLTNLLASTYLGGSLAEYVYSIVIGASGNVYVTGQTSSSDFPTTPGAYDTSLGDASAGDAFVAKFNGDLTNLFASTYLGGSSLDMAISLAVDADENIYVAGQTTSSNFPTTTNAFATSNKGLLDVFVSRLNGDLTSLLASTYLGGAFIEFDYSLAIGPDGRIYVVGETVSSDFPTTKGAFDRSLGGGEAFGDAFVSRLDGDLTSLLASTFLGGSSIEFAYDIAIDKVGNVYVTGVTYSPDFPTTKGAYKRSLKGELDAFVSSFNKNLTRLRASTYLGGSSDDYGYSIAIDSRRNIYVAGYTSSSDFPTTKNAYDTSYNGNMEVFVSRLKGNLKKLLSSTYLGGFDKDYCYSMALDPERNIYVGGYTTSSDFPETNSTFYRGGNDAFVSRFDENLSASTTSGQNGMMSGYVADNEGIPIETAKISVKGVKTGAEKNTSSDGNGFFVFEDLDADTYKITTRKTGYRRGKQTVALEEGEGKCLEIMQKK